jgi:hypothetical protein
MFFWEREIYTNMLNEHIEEKKQQKAMRMASKGMM